MILDTAVIPCGGLGRRLRPISNWVPKEMLPVGLKPLLYWALDEASVAGLQRVILVINPHKPMIEAAARQYQGALELEFVHQPSYRGLGDALLAAEEAIGEAPFIVIQPDQLFDGPNPTAAVLASWRATGRASVLLTDIDEETARRTGALGRATVAAEDGTMRVSAVESRGSSLGRFGAGGENVMAPAGRLAVPASIFGDIHAIEKTVPAGAELDDRPVLQRLAARGDLLGVHTSARIYDIGVPEGYRAAVARWPAVVG